MNIAITIAIIIFIIMSSSMTLLFFLIENENSEVIMNITKEIKVSVKKFLINVFNVLDNEYVKENIPAVVLSIFCLIILNQGIK